MNKLDSLNVLNYQGMNSIVLKHDIFLESMVFFLFVAAVLFFIGIFGNNRRSIGDYISYFTTSDERNVFSILYLNKHKILFHIFSVFIYSLLTLFSSCVLFKNGNFFFEKNVYLLAIGYTFIFFLLKSILCSWVGLTFFDRTKVESWFQAYFQASNISAFLLVPFICIIYMKISVYEVYIVLLSALIVIIFVILLLLKTRNIFKQKGNLFYLILYLCALEIVPAIFYVKSIVSLL